MARSAIEVRQNGGFIVAINGGYKSVLTGLLITKYILIRLIYNFAYLVS